MNPLEKIDQALKNKVEDLKNEKRQQEIVGLIALLGENIVSQIQESISAIDIKAPEVHVSVPDVNVPEIKLPSITVPDIKAPEVTVNIPEIKIPDIHVPEIKLPTINVPEPKVTVNVPKADAPIVNIPPFPEFPTQMSIAGDVGLRDISPKSPLPVLMMDGAGKPMSFAQSMGGGRGDFFTIKDIQTSSGASLIDQVEGAMKVTGNFSITSSATSTYAMLVNADGTLYDSNNPLPITGSLSTTPGATFYASDAVGSVNVIQSIPLDVNQISGAIWSTYITGAIGTMGVVTINPDGLPVYGGSSGGGLTDTELRATSVPVSQVSGSSWSTNVLSLPSVTVTSVTNSIAASLLGGDGATLDPRDRNWTVTETVPISLANTIDVRQVSGAAWTVSVSDIFGSVATNVVNPDGRLKVELPSGASSLTDTELRAAHLDTQQLSGAIDSVYVTGVAASVYAEILNPDGRVKVELPTGSSGLTDTELRASHLDVDQVSGSSWSTNVLSMPAVVVTSITNTIAASLVDSSGIQYSGTNPVPVENMLTAMTTNPTAVGDGALSFAKTDDIGRQVMTVHQVRDLIATAYLAPTSVAPATLLASGGAGVFHDLILLTASNTSTAAITAAGASIGFDVLDSNTGGVVFSLSVPNGNTISFYPSTPIKQSEADSSWRVDITTDTSGLATVQYLKISALFAKNV